MPKATLEKSDVLDALAHFRAQGVMRPGLLRLQKHIGRGSIPRLRRLLHEIELEQLEQLAPALLERVPDPISMAAARLWAEMTQSLEAKEQEIEAQTQARLAALQERLDKADAALNAQREQYEQQQVEYRALGEQHARLEQQFQAQSQALAVKTQETSHLMRELAQAQEQIRHLRAEQAEQAKHAAQREAQYVARLDIERQRSQDEARAYQQRLEEKQSQLAAVQDALAAVRAEQAAQRAQQDTLERQLKQQLLEQAEQLDSLKAHRAEQQAYAEGLQNSLAYVMAHAEDWRQSCVNAQKRNTHLEAALRKAHQQISYLVKKQQNTANPPAEQ